MQERKIQSEELPDIISFLATVDSFKGLNTSALKDIAKSMSLVFVESGETLIKQWESDPTLYVLYNGRLRVYIQKDSKSESVNVAEISVGQIVGEIALLTNMPRTATVRAVRDSLALKLDQSHFHDIEKKHPSEVIDIAKKAIKRLVVPPRPTQEGENIHTIVVAPAGDSDHRLFIKYLVEEYNKIKPTLLINKEFCNEHFKKNIAQTMSNDPDNQEINHWLTGLEQSYSYIIYETDRQMTPWTQRCLRQADKILLVADDTTYPTFNSIEINLFATPHQTPLPCIELIIIHPDDSTSITGSGKWLKTRTVHGFHHLKLGSQKDFAKLMRFFNGKALGLVLNGGGARAFSHAGVIKALGEMNIPIDFVGGTSMGACLGALYALKGEKDMFALENDKRIVSLASDYTFPMISLLKGRNVTELFREYYGEDTLIEDLTTRFFCVSANVTESKIHVHDRGVLHNAVRATISLPAIFPPFYDAEGNMLVDGGVINNMPVDIMRNLISGGKIIAVNSNSGGHEMRRHFADKQWLSGLKLLFQKLNPFNKEPQSYDTIFQILRASMSLSADNYQQAMSKQADFLFEVNTSKYEIFAFDKRHEIIQRGYEAAMEKLSYLPELRDYINPK